MPTSFGPIRRAGSRPTSTLPRLRLAALGCGRVFERFHLPALRRSDEWSLGAAVDPSVERLRWAGTAAPGIPLATSLGELDRSTDFDAVLVSTPPDTHCVLAAEALRRGIHVLIEKPMALRPAEAASLVALAQDLGRQVWVGYNRRFRPSYRRLRERLGRLPADRIREVTCELCSVPNRWDAVTGYLSVRERGGDLLDDIASHQLDLLPWVMDRPVEEVRARFEQRDADAVVAVLELRLAGGLVARCRAGHGPLASEHFEVRLPDQTLIASQGGLAAARWTPRRLVSRGLSLRTFAGAVSRRVRGAPGYTLETFGRQLDAWARAIRGGDPTGAADGTAGLRCVELVEACRQSLAVGGAWVAVPGSKGPR